MVVGTAGDDIDAPVDKGAGHGAGVGHDLLLVGNELVALGFQKADRLGRNHVHQRAALAAGKHRGIKLLLQFLVGAGQDNTAARSPQRLVGGGGHHIGVRHGVGVNACGYQAGHVGHVDQQVGTHLVGDLAKTPPVHYPAVRRETGDDHFRFMLQRQRLNLGIVHLASGVIQAILDGIEVFAGEIRLGTVGQVATVGQAHAQNGIARAHQCQENSVIRLGAGMGLNIGIIGTKQGFRPLDGQFLGFINEFTAAVIAFAGIPFSILVGQHSALGLHDARAGIILGRDELYMLFLPALLVLNRAE